MPSNNLILYDPHLLLPSVFRSIRVFLNESVHCIRWPKCWSFSFSSSPSNEYSGLISFITDLSDLLSIQETLKSLLQHHSLKASVLQCSAFFIIQFSQPYMTSGEKKHTHNFEYAGKVTFLVLNMLSRFVIAFLPRRKHLLLSRLQSQSAVILESNKIKSVTISITSWSIQKSDWLYSLQPKVDKLY